MENLNITEKQLKAILNQIKSDDSPVGIDAGKTHAIIIQKLLDIDKRLQSLEEVINGKERQ
ncbi:hypothetical protein LQ318_02450 [Aliifodinibius salicampi]|uniref:Uncharacterized protein n=1 Tax=Fodinibius salicampi TaxID=1920655 RepID=A0ABT3PV84_9BACT|nr:hypothetical protein [Fodinibius salicampi]MCW9711753.1 hypothetical protein [Fodinibius salicampi]